MLTTLRGINSRYAARPCWSSWSTSSRANHPLRQQPLRQRIGGHAVVRPHDLERLRRRDPRIDDAEVLELHARLGQLAGRERGEAAQAGFDGPDQAVLDRDHAVVLFREIV